MLRMQCTGTCQHSGLVFRGRENYQGVHPFPEGTRKKAGKKERKKAGRKERRKKEERRKKKEGSKKKEEERGKKEEARRKEKETTHSEGTE